MVVFEIFDAVGFCSHQRVRLDLGKHDIRDDVGDLGNGLNAGIQCCRIECVSVERSKDGVLETRLVCSGDTNNPFCIGVRPEAMATEAGGGYTFAFELG